MALIAVRAVPPTSTVATGRGIGVVVPVAAVASSANCDGDTLYNAPMVVASRIHAVVDGEVAADQIGAHGGILARQNVVLKDGVGLVFAVVDADDAGIPACASKRLIERLRPAATSTET